MKTYMRRQFKWIVKAMESARPGTMFWINGYASETRPGEVADYCCQFGASYRNALVNDVAILKRTAAACKAVETRLRVEHGAWVDPKGFEGLMPSPFSLVTAVPTPGSVYGRLTRTERLHGFNSSITTEGFIRLSALKARESSERVYVRVSYAVDCGHPLFRKAIGSMLASLTRRLEALDRREMRAKKTYRRECKGVYSLSSDRGSLYIRNALVVWKKDREVAYPSGPEAKSPPVAVKEGIERQVGLRTGRIRSFVVGRESDASSRFESISIGGSIVAPDLQGNVTVLERVAAETQRRP